MAGDLCSEMFFAVGLEIFCAIHNLELVVKSAQLCQYVQTVILCTEDQTLFTKPELLCHSLILIQTQTHICLVCRQLSVQISNICFDIGSNNVCSSKQVTTKLCLNSNKPFALLNPDLLFIFRPRTNGKQLKQFLISNALNVILKSK